MDTAMRDMDQIRERHPEDGPGRRTTVLVLAGLVTVSLVLAMGMLMGDSEAQPAEEDPLAALDRAAGLSALDEGGDDAEEEEPVTVDREALTFPERLTEDDRPEVEAAIAAAGAEAAHPDPVLGHFPAPSETGEAAVPPLPLPAPGPSAALIETITQALPAASAADNTAVQLARTAMQDPLVARSLPRDSGPRRMAPRGMDGLYTLQVISYRTEAEADEFSSALRSRGHESFVVSADIPDRGRYYRVRIGPFETQREADDYRATFERSENMSAFVVRRRDEDEAPTVTLPD